MNDFYNKQAKIFFKKEVKTVDRKNKINKFSLLAFTLLFFFVLLLSSNISAQVIIKEKVEINPQSNKIVYLKSVSSFDVLIYTFLLSILMVLFHHLSVVFYKM